MKLAVGAPSSNAAMARSAGLDALRAVACAMVLLFHLHTVARVGFGPFDPMVSGGDTGVFVFFALSGYLLYRGFVGHRPDLVGYGIKRAARIIPGYLLALVCLTLLTGSTLPAANPIPYLAIASSYISPLRGFLGSAWTLSAEVLFYVTLPLIARAADGREFRVLGGLAAASVSGAFLLRVTLSGDAQLVLSTYPLVFYAFVPGMFLAVIERSRPAAFARLARWPWFVLGAAYIASGTLFTTFPIAFAPTIGASLLMGWLLQHRIPAARTFAFLGGMSYAAYLWHKDLLIAFGPAGLPLALVGAAVSWALVERPILKWAHRLVLRVTPVHPVEQPAPVAGS